MGAHLNSCPLPMPSGPHPFTDPQGSSLRSRLEEVALDRAAPARQIVQETAGILRGWLLELPPETPLGGSELEEELGPWIEDQAWRGPCALWLDSARRAWASPEEQPEGGARGSARDSLVREAGAWCEERDTGPGVDRRLPSRAALASRAAADLGRGEVILVTAWSETVTLALEAAWRLGRRPEAVLVEGMPGMDGRRMARRLSRAGIPVTMTYDAALLDLVPRADRVWLSTEAIGAGAFLARRGTRCLLEECSRRDVPTRILATSDKLVPGGELRLPAWGDRDPWLLWEDAPEGVRLESQCFERVPLDLAGGLLTEMGFEKPSALHLRALRVDAAPPCGARRPLQSARTS
ncbi:MAG: hypothetical protein ACKVXR_06035 [Planctomycetota bacterium]